MSGSEHQLDGNVSYSTSSHRIREELCAHPDMLSRSKLIPTLFMHYNLELSDPDAEWTTSCYWFVMQRGVNVRLMRRNS